jgi:hypothetical protein
MHNYTIYVLTGFTPPQPIVHTIHVDEIPEGLLEDETKSNSASNMFSTDELKVWFRNLINPSELVFDHPIDADNDPDAARNFEHYIGEIENDGFRVWDVQNRIDANTRLVLESNGTSVTISGRPDFLICSRDSVLGNYLWKTCCIVEMQSNDDEERCELQLMVYIFVFMNKYGLDQVVGFLIYNDGQVRAYKASRSPTNIVYEENDRFHIQHIGDV